MYHSQFHGQAPSGLQAFSTLAWGSHVGQVYRSAEDLCEVLVPYFRAGLENNERCLWVTDAPLEADAARAALRQVVTDLDEREARGEIVIQDGSAFYDREKSLEAAALVDGLLQMEKDALAAGYKGVRTNGNCGWVAEAHWDDFCDYETRVHEAIHDRKLICMCSFSHDGFSRGRLSDIVERHDLVLHAKKPLRESLNAPAGANGSARGGEGSAVPNASPAVDDVIATELLSSRPSRPANYKAENEALASLIKAINEAPDTILQLLANTALSLCDAGSAGISIAETGAGQDIFRWRATAGRYHKYLHATMPRHFSPCGEVLNRDEAILMRGMVNYYGYVAPLDPPPHEVLLVPFYDAGQAVGTVWVVAHDDNRQFDAEDLRIVTSLTNFASVTMQAFARTRELERANAAASAAGEMREEFIAVLGHDLRNPLGAIVNGAKMLERGAPPERIAPLGQIIGRSAYRIGELVDNLLDFARGRLGGGIGIEVQDHETLGPVLDHVVEELQGAYPTRIVESRYAFGAPVSVDANRIAQMVSNLVGNALTHGNPDTPVTLSAHSTDEALIISVGNRGKPIPPAVMERLFRPFERGGPDANREGLGLGLYICSEIAKAHGGELTVASTDDKTVFQFTMRRSSDA